MTASAPGRLRAGARDVTMGSIAGFLTRPGNLGRPVLDRMGFGGTFDFTLEWTPEIGGVLAPRVEPDPSGPTFLEALKGQLGLKLEPAKGQVVVFVIDHVERPGEN